MIRSIVAMLATLVTIATQVFSLDLTHTWSQRFGDEQIQLAWSVATDNLDNVVVTGRLGGTVNFGGDSLTTAGSYDIYVAKFDSDGNHLWSQRFGDEDAQSGSSITTDTSGNMISTGWFWGNLDFGGDTLTCVGQRDIYVVKFDAAGNHLWSKRFGGGGTQVGSDIAVDGSGNVIVTGESQGSIDFGGGVRPGFGGWDIFVAKFDDSGNHIWSNIFGDGGDQWNGDVTADGSGNVIVTGHFRGSVDFGGNTLTTAGQNDIYIAKFSHAGDHLWSKSFGDPSMQWCHDIACDSLDNLVITGSFSGTVNFGGDSLTTAGDTDIYVAKFDADGNHIWSKRFGGASNQDARGVTTDGLGNVIVTGSFGGDVDFGGGALTSAGYNVYVAKFDPTGNHLISGSFGDTHSQFAEAITTDGSDNVCVAGYYYGTMDFGGGPLISAGNEDIFLVKFDSSTIPFLLQCPPDTTVGSFSILDSLVLSGFQITNTAEAESLSFIYDVVTSGMAALVDRGDPASISGITPTLAPGESYSPSLAALLVPAIREDLEQSVTYRVAPEVIPGGLDSCMTRITFWAPVPVFVSAFNAVAVGRGVELVWDIVSDEDVKGFRIYRSAEGSQTREIVNLDKLIPAAAREYVDRDTRAGQSYEYTLGIVLADDSESISQTVTVKTKAYELALHQNHPNPFNPSTKIGFTLPKRVDTNLAVYNIEGKLVTTLVDETLDAGFKEVTWHGKDARGNQVSTGVYFYRLTAGNRTLTKKMVLLK